MMSTFPAIRARVCLAGAGLVLVLVSGCSGRAPSLGSSPRPTSSSEGIVLEAHTAAPSWEDTPAASPPSVPVREVPSPSLPAGQKGIARGQIDPTNVDRMNPDAVASAFAATLAAVDTKIDNRPNDAAARAATYVTDDLSAAMTASAPISNPGAAWTTLHSHQGWTRVTTGKPTTLAARRDTSAEVWRTVTTVATPTSSDGWSGSHVELTWTLQLTRTSPSGPWRVARYEETAP